MEKDSLNVLFSKLSKVSSLEEPKQGHAQRFAKKLQKKHALSKRKKSVYRISFVASIAAVLILGVSIFTNHFPVSSQNDLASVSPEMKQAQAFFTSTIANELKLLKQAQNATTKTLVNDALQQLNRLEKEYQILIEDLSKSGNNKRVIHAMIANFQKRIELLEHTLQQINTLKKLNLEHYETTL